MKRCFAFLLTVFVALSLTAFAHAGTYPDKSIKIIVPFNPGGDLGRVPPGQLSRVRFVLMMVERRSIWRVLTIWYRAL